jgi:hypothetical protein
MIDVATRRGRIRPMSAEARRFVRPATTLGLRPSAPSASAATSAGSMTGADTSPVLAGSLAT